MIGQTLGHYEITGSLGKGGMGEVWRARDTRLGREVAIKTLPTELAADTGRLARFEREAKLLATLNHAHIASIYGIDEHRGTRYLAMELVEGETLEERLKEGALPPAEALRLGLQIAQALEAAHEKGVVHRDLKPANVMIARDVVKVLDFGLAKAFSGKPEEASPVHSPALSLAMTQQGIILGTAAYMSPEQASGQATDQRADVWGFGVVLYEMLTGLPLFSGDSVPHVLADVLKSEPDWKRLPKNLHPRVKLLLERCLVKKPRNRYHSIADVRIDLEQVLADPRGIERREEMHSAPRPLMTRLASGAGLFVVGALIAGIAAWTLRPEPEPPRVVRLSYTVETLTGVSFPTISSDGRRVGFVAGIPRMAYVLPTEAFDARPIADTTGTVQGWQCLSPDGSWSAYSVTNTEMRKVPVTGGRGFSLGFSDARFIVGCHWADDGYIYIAAEGGIVRMPEAGGSTEQITTFATTGEPSFGHLAPQLLPGGRDLLYSIVSTSAAGTFVARAAVLDLETQQVAVLDGIEGMSQFVPTDSDSALGHLVFGRSGTLFAAPFDVQRRLAGPAVPMAEDALIVNDLTVAMASNEGTLTYFSGTGYGSTASVLSTVAFAGTPERLPVPADSFIHVAVSATTNRAVIGSLTLGDTVSADLWTYDFDTGGLDRLVLPGFNRNPLWSSDAERIVYESAPVVVAPNVSINSIEVDGSDSPLTLATLQNSSFTMTSIAPDDSVVIGILPDSASRGDVYALALGDGLSGSPATERDLVALWTSRSNELHATFSPDGRWIAYSSDETGSDQIFVRSYPALGRATQVSRTGGQQPRWHPDGSALFYRNGTAIMSVAVDAGVTDAFEHGPPMQVAEVTIAEPLQGEEDSFEYDVMPDGESFLFLGEAGEVDVPGELRVIINASEELRVLAPLAGIPP